MDSEGPPRKRPRTATAFAPDGFVPSKPRPKAAASAPKFFSAFEGNPSTSRAQKPTSVGKAAVPRFQSGFDDTTPSSLPKPPSKASVRSLDIQRLHGLHQSKQPALVVARKPENLRVQKAPVVARRVLPDTKREESPAKKLTELVLPWIVLAPPQAGDASHPPSTPPRGKRSLTLPPSIADSSRPATVKMKTIFTTGLARATDLNSEHGPAQLLSIFLQQNLPDFVDPTDRELQRGLGQSPEKASKKKAPKYVRGGLADCANGLFQRHDRLLGLWQKDVGAKLQQELRVPPVELRLRILSIVHSTLSVSPRRSPAAPPIAVLHCHLYSKPEGEDIAAMLYFDSPPNASSRLNKVEDLKEGGEIYIWSPWRILQLDGVPDSAQNPIEKVTGEHELTSRTGWLRSGRVLFCSRFWIVPPAHM